MTYKAEKSFIFPAEHLDYASLSIRWIAARSACACLTPAAAKAPPLRIEALTQALEWAATDMRLEPNTCVSLTVLPSPLRRQTKPAGEGGPLDATPRISPDGSVWTAAETRTALKSFATRKHYALLRSAAPPPSNPCRTTVRVNLPTGPIDGFAVRFMVLARNAGARQERYSFRVLSGRLGPISKSDGAIIVS